MAVGYTIRFGYKSTHTLSFIPTLPACGLEHYSRFTPLHNRCFICLPTFMGTIVVVWNFGIFFWIIKDNKFLCLFDHRIPSWFFKYLEHCFAGPFPALPLSLYLLLDKAICWSCGVLNGIIHSFKTYHGYYLYCVWLCMCMFKDKI